MLKKDNIPVNYGKYSKNVAAIFFVSDQRPNLAIQDLRNFFSEKSSDPRLVNIVF